MDGSRLIHNSQTSRMEENHSLTPVLHLLRQEHTRSRRMSRLIVAALLLLVVLVVALFAAVLHGGRAPSDSKEVMQPCSPTTELTSRQQQIEDFETPSAMLTAPGDDNIHEEFLAWESQRGNAHLHGGFSYSNRSLVVPRRGIYRVFLQITFSGRTEECCEGRQLMKLTNIVYLSRDNYPKDVILLSSFDTVSCSNMEHFSKSIYTGGLFALEPNSRILVKSSCHKLIGKNQDEVFFGAELVRLQNA